VSDAERLQSASVDACAEDDLTEHLWAMEIWRLSFRSASADDVQLGASRLLIGVANSWQPGQRACPQRQKRGPWSAQPAYAGAQRLEVIQVQRAAK